MQRHEVICRASNEPKSNPEVFVTLNLQNGEDGWSWGKANVLGSTLEMHVAALVARLEGGPPGSIPNVTITTRSAAEIEADPPLVEQWYGRLVDTLPGANIDALVPIRHEKPERTRFELWSACGRSRGHIYCNQQRKFIARLLGDAVRSFFNDGESRDPRFQPTYKDWARNGSLSEYWVRPCWRLGDNPEFLPGLFPESKPAAPIDPALLAAKASREEFAKRKNMVRDRWRVRAALGTRRP